MIHAKRPRTTPLQPADLTELHAAVTQAEAALLFARVDDPCAEAIRSRACDLTADLLSALAQLRRQLTSPRAATRETIGQWLARQAAPSGVVHQPKPNGRGGMHAA